MDELEPTPIETTLPPVPSEDFAVNSGPGINLGSQDATPSQGIDLMPEEHTSGLTPQGIQSRAALTHYALQDKSPGQPNLETAIQSGREGEIRANVSFEQKIKQNTAAMSMIKQITQNGDKPLLPEEETAVMGLAKSMNDPDPNTILERLWAHNYVKELVTTRSPVVQEAMTVAPMESMGIAGRSDDVIATRQTINSIKEEFDKKYADMPNFSIDPSKQTKTDAWVTSFIPLVNNYLKHNAVAGMEKGNTDLLPGNNMAEMKDYVYLLGPEKAGPLVRNAAERMFQYSPHAAMEMLESLVQLPNDKVMVDNMMGVADVATVFPGGLLARGARAEAHATQKIMQNVPVQVTEDFVKANEHILFDPKQIQEILEKGTLAVQRPGVANTPRGMALYELRKAAEAFPQEGGYYPSSLLEGHSAGSVGLPRGTLEGEVSGYYSGGREVKVSGNDKFVSQEELSKIPEGSRIFQNKDGELAVTQNVEGKWTPTGETLKVSTTPEKDLVPLNLGPEKNSMGAKYYDNYSTGAPVSALTRRMAENSEPYQMGIRDIDRIREGTPGYRLSPTFNTEAFKEANINVRLAQVKVDDARRALDDIQKTGDEAGIASQKARIAQLDGELNTARETRSSTSFMNKHPALLRAEQGMRSYLSSGIRSLKELPTGTNAETRMDLQGSLTTLGRMDEAIQTGAIRKTMENVSTEPLTKEAEAVSFGKDLPTFMRPNFFEENSSALSREGAMRMSEELSRNADLLKEAASGQRVQRTTKEDIINLYNQSKASVLQKYTGDFNNSVLDQQMVYNPLENLHYVKTRLGKTDATGFADKDAAYNTMTQLYGVNPRDVLITQEGNSFFGNVLTPVNETGIRTTGIPTSNKTPDYWGGFGLKYLRSATDQLSDLQNQARYTATHTPQRINQVVKNITQDINKLDTESFGRLGEMLKQSELEFDASGNKGLWYSVNQLETEFGKRYGSMPSEQFVKSYFSYKQLMDFDYEMRKNYIYSAVSRWGGETIKFKYGTEGAESAEFSGRYVDAIDQAKLRNRGVLMEQDGELKQVWTNDLKIDKTLGDEFKRLMEEEGHELVQLWEPLKKPLKDTHGGDIYYVLSNKFERRNVDPTSVLPYRGGPHVAYTHPHFVGQPLIVTDSAGQPVYAGDQIFRSGGSTEAEGRAWAKKYDTARQLMNGGDDAALADHLAKNLPEDMDTFKKMFTGDNALDRDRPIAYHYSGNNIFDNNPELFDPDTGYNGQVYNYHQIKEYMNDMADPAAALNSGYVQERANMELQVPKDLGNDIPDRFKLEGAGTLDPYISLNRALKQANRVHFMEDYKVLAAESFVKEFGKHLENVSTEALQRNPLHYLYNGTIASATPQDVKVQMEMYRTHVKNFIGMQSSLGDELSSYEAKMQNSIYNKLGSEATGKLLENNFIANYAIPFIKDPASYARAWAFKSRMGFFNPIQYIQQGQSAVQAVAISPVAGWDGIKMASYLHLGGKYALDDPAKMEYYVDKIAKSSSVTKDDAREILQGYKDSGFGIIGHETAWKNDFSDPKVFQSTASKWLDKGDVFFNAGEGFARDTSYFTAFKEWKNANPGRVADQFDLGEILRRAEDMSSNMTRASNSALQSNSFASIPLQFQTFRIRQMELLLGGGVTGGRLSAAEKGRLLFTNSVLYGVPTAISGGTLYNFYDDIKQAAAERGYNLNEGYLQAIHGGVMQWMINATTGKNLDIPTAYGPGASSWFNNVKDAWMGNDNAKSIGELALGPVGANIKDFAFATAPVIRWGVGKVTGEEYPLTSEDFMRFSALTTTTDSARIAWQAYNVGKWYSKSGTPMGDMTTWDGLLKAGFGLTPQQYQDAFHKMGDDKKVRGWQEQALKEARNELQLASESMLKGEDYQEHFKKAQYIFESNDIPNEKRVATFLDAQKSGDLYNRMNNYLYKEPTQSGQERQMNKTLEQGRKQ